MAEDGRGLERMERMERSEGLGVEKEYQESILIERQLLIPNS